LPVSSQGMILSPFLKDELLLNFRGSSQSRAVQARCLEFSF
jgi:hypothetical protein